LEVVFPAYSALSYSITGYRDSVFKELIANCTGEGIPHGIIIVFYLDYQVDLVPHRDILPHGKSRCGRTIQHFSGDITLHRFREGFTALSTYGVVPNPPNGFGFYNDSFFSPSQPHDVSYKILRRGGRVVIDPLDFFEPVIVAKMPEKRLNVGW
jgi:hypothetical protein